MATQLTLNDGSLNSAGALKIKTNGTTEAVDISTGQVVTLAKDAVVNGLTVGKGAGAVSTNTAVGYQSLLSNTSGAANTSVGYNSQALNTTGPNNSSLGTSALVSNTTGGYNTAIGASALVSNTTASNNTAVGYQAGYSGTTGFSNAYFGVSAGYSNVSGAGNTFLGVGAGYYVTGGRNTIIGQYSGNQGGLDIRTASNYIVLSDGDGLPRIYTNGSGYPFLPYARANAGSYALKFTTSAEVVFDTSSARYKDNIRNSTYGLTAVMALQSRMFEYKSEPERTDIGLVAEEVFEVIPELVTLNAEGQPDAVSYDRFVSVCIKAIQELKAEFDAYKEAHP